MVYAYRMHSTMTDNSFWFLSDSIFNLKSSASKIGELFNLWLNVDDNENEQETILNELNDYCRDNRIVMDWDGDVDSQVYFDPETDTYKYDGQSIRIIGNYTLRF